MPPLEVKTGVLLRSSVTLKKLLSGTTMTPLPVPSLEALVSNSGVSAAIAATSWLAVVTPLMTFRKSTLPLTIAASAVLVRLGRVAS